MNNEDLAIEFANEMARQMVMDAYGEEAWEENGEGVLEYTFDADRYFEKEKKYLLDYIEKYNIKIELDGDNWKLTQQGQ